MLTVVSDSSASECWWLFMQCWMEQSSVLANQTAKPLLPVSTAMLLGSIKTLYVLQVVQRHMKLPKKRREEIWLKRPLILFYSSFHVFIFGCYRTRKFHSRGFFFNTKEIFWIVFFSGNQSYYWEEIELFTSWNCRSRQELQHPERLPTWCHAI